jgi:2-polyprenyl-6-methoxyphenol hydroxylase-like FAD-dependent oxidoreductase
MSAKDKTTCVVVGGGPAGMVLGLLLARAGVEVTVLEKHGDFLRDFRGDTVHPSTLTLLDELGLGEEFARLPQSEVDQVQLPTPGGDPLTLGDFSLIPGPYKHIAMVPQWDLLDLLADAGKQEPTFHLRMNTEVTGLRRSGEKVTGVRYRTKGGETGEIVADLTIGCDGRHSAIRDAAGFVPHEYPVPIDAWWFRLSRNTDRTMSGLMLNIKATEMAIALPREGYYQIAYIARKGSDPRLRAEGVEAFRRRIANVVPSLADRVDQIETMDDVKMLDVKLNRLHRWYGDGVLCIGDAAHAMSPIGGVGINVAVQDAVAAARILARPLLAGKVRRSDLARVQIERWFPTAVIQGLQRIMHRRLIGPIVRGERADYPKPLVALLTRFPKLRKVPAYIVGIGPRPEHAPEWARR